MSKRTKKFPDLEERIAALPDKRRMHNWTPELDRMLLKFIPTKGVNAVATLLGLPYATVNGRYNKIRSDK